MKFDLPRSLIQFGFPFFSFEYKTAFLETNPALVFNRKLSLGRRLNVPSGASVRFEPGEQKTVTLVSLGGKQNVVCGNGLTGGVANVGDEEQWNEIEKRMKDKGGFGNVKSDENHQFGFQLTPRQQQEIMMEHH